MGVAKHRTDIFSLVAILVLLYAIWSNIAGWFLSSISCLNSIGYFFAVIPFLFVSYRLLRKYLKADYSLKISWRSLRIHEFAYAAVLVTVLLGSLLYSPFGWDATAYRLPRVLRWLAGSEWHWLDAADDRMDISAMGFEWMIAPHYALLRSDRFLFLINFIPYLCLPKLLWHAARALGVSRRFSLILSLLFPLGFCYALQAGGIQNDGIGAFFVLLPLALHHKKFASWLPDDIKFGLGILSLAIVTGLKLSNLPIAGVIFIWTLWTKRTVAIHSIRKFRWALSVGCLAVACSVVPISAINLHHTGHWSGDPDNRYHHNARNPLSAVGANLLFLSSDAISPNVMADRMNHALKESQWINHFIKKIELDHPNIKYFRFSKYGYEGDSGPSFPILIGITILVVTGMVFFRQRRIQPRSSKIFLLLVMFAYLVFLGKVAVHGSQRHAAPYYPAICLGVVALFSGYIRRLPSKLVALVVVSSCFVTIVTLVISPIRPLLPTSICDRLDQMGGAYRLHRESSEWGKVLQKYQEQRIFCVSHWGAVTYQFWPPYFQGSMIEVNSAAFDQKMMKGSGMLFASEAGIEKRYGLSLEEFVQTTGCKEIEREAYQDARSEGEIFILYRVDDLSKFPVSKTKRLYPNS